MHALTRLAKVLFISIIPTVSYATPTPLPGDTGCLSGDDQSFDPVMGGYCTSDLEQQGMIDRLKPQMVSNHRICADGASPGGTCRTVDAQHVPILETGGIFFSATCWKSIGMEEEVERLFLVNSSEMEPGLGLFATGEPSEVALVSSSPRGSSTPPRQNRPGGGGGGGFTPVGGPGGGPPGNPDVFFPPLSDPGDNPDGNGPEPGPPDMPPTVPLPSGIALALAGLFGLTAIGYRRRLMRD